MNHDLVTIGVPVLAILFASFLNRSNVQRLEDRMNKRFEAMDRRFDTMESRFDTIHRDFREFHGTPG